LYVPGGTLHAIGEGCLILEIQQTSDTTYRLYDWERVGPDGRPRALHLQKGLEALRWGVPPPTLLAPVEDRAHGGRNRHFRILRSDFFALHKTLLLAEERVDLCGSTFHALFAADAPVRIRWDAPQGEFCLSGGDSCLVPAGLSCYHVAPAAPSGATLLTTTLV
jgi:mannose-6-phosphate isomerase